MNDGGLIAPYLASSLVNVCKPENKSQFRLKKDLNSTKMNDFLINEGYQLLLSVICQFLEIATNPSN